MLTMLPAILPIISQVLQQILPDKALQAQAQVALAQLDAQGKLKELDIALQSIAGQLAINKAEAENTSLWVSGWRPFVGWVCASALAYIYLFNPFISTILGTFGVHVLQIPLDTAQLMTLLGGMLGFGILRTYDKQKASINRQAFFDAIRAKAGTLTQQQVDLLNSSLDKSESSS